MLYLLRVASIVAFAGLLVPSLAAAHPHGMPFAELSDQIEGVEDQVEDLQTSVDGLDGKADTLQDSIDDIEDKVDDLQDSVDAALDGMMVPFRTTIEGGMCDSAEMGTSNPLINIGGSLEDGTFVVNSILVQTSSFTESNRILTTHSFRVDGIFFQASSARIFNTFTNVSPGAGVVPPAFDLMGLRLLESANGGDVEEGGIFPTQIVATSNGGVAISVMLFCRSDLTDWNISSISVAGMKRADDDITVSYTPGN